MYIYFNGYKIKLINEKPFSLLRFFALWILRNDHWDITSTVTRITPNSHGIFYKDN